MSVIPAVSRMDTQEYLRRLSTAFVGIQVDGIDGISRVYLRILSCLLRATKTFYFAMWCCDFTMELYEGRSFHDWIVLRCKDAPDLRIYGMVHDNPENAFPEGWDSTKQVYPHAQVSIRVVPMYNRGTMAYLLHGHPGSNCVVGGTLVTLANGTSTAIEDIQVGDIVLGRSRIDNNEGFAARPVTAVHDNGKRECIELLFDDGRVLRCTADHRILTSNSTWVSAGDLAVGKDAVMAGVEFPAVARQGREVSTSAGSWSVDTGCSGIGRLRVSSMKSSNCALAFARILGYLLTDGGMYSTTDHGSVQARLFIGHKLDVASVEADIRLLVGKNPTVKRGHSTWTVALPAALQHVTRNVGVTVGKRVNVVTHLPTFILHAQCPVAVVREFLGGLFGGDGSAPSLKHDAGVPHGFSAVRFYATKKGDVAREQEAVFRCELLPLLARCGIDTRTVTVTIREVGATSITAAGRAELAEQKLANVQLSHTVRENTALDSHRSYVICIALSATQTTCFQSAIGFRHCCHKQLRLTAAAAYYRASEYVQRQRHWLIARVTTMKQLVGKSRFSVHDALEQAKRELRTTELLHPDVQKWTLAQGRMRELRASARAAIPIGEALEEWNIRLLFSEPRMNPRYISREERATNIRTKKRRASASPENQSRLRKQKTDRINCIDGTSEIGSSMPGDGTQGVLDASTTTEDKVRHAVPADCLVLPFFRIRLIGRRAIGLRQVYDLSVPNGGDDWDSFNAAGLCVHNCIHQKWVLSDRKHLLLSGCDIRPIYRCDFPRGERNSAGWYWRDITLHLRPDKNSQMTELPPSWTDFLIANVHSGGQLSRTEGLIPLPFINQFSLPMSEASVIVFLIETAERFIYIENQYFHSSKATDNRIMEALVNRLRRALTERQDDFHVIVVSNWAMKDEKSIINTWGIQSSLCSSISTLHSMSKCSMEDLDRHVWIGYAEEQVATGDSAAITMVSPASSFVLAASSSAASPSPSVDATAAVTSASCVPSTPGAATSTAAAFSAVPAAQAARLPFPIPIYIHSKLFSVDESSLVCGSANLCDRSLSRDNSDNELSMVLFRQPHLVRPIFQQVIRTLAGPPPSRTDDSLSTEAERWEVADLFRSLAVARMTGQPFRCFHPIERQLPRGFSVWGSVFEIANYGYL
jgi:phosphatidylserine/phosphatidylglycerophosphate/cardiolipin synthase-like enzyme